MKIRFSTPYAVRETARQIENILGLNLGIPMNAEISNLADDGGERGCSFTFHWEGKVHATGRVIVGDYESLNGFYQEVRLVSLRFRRPYHGRKPMVRRNGEVIFPLPSNTMAVLEKIGASMEYTGEKFALRLNEEQLGDVRHFAERYPEVKLG